MKENNENLIQEIDKYIKSHKKVTLNKLLKENFISSYLPQDIYYNDNESIGQKNKQFMRVIENYKEYRKFLETISNSKTPEFLAILINYDIIKNNMINKVENIPQLRQTLIKELRLQWVQELDNLANFYCDSTLSSIKNDKNICECINGVLSKKFAFNLYLNIIKNENMYISKKMDKISESSNFMLKKHKFYSYADAYETVSEIIIKYFNEKDINIQSDKDFLNLEQRINSFYDTLEFPENLKKLGYTSENIMFQIAANSFLKKNEFIVNVLKFSNRYGDKLRNWKQNVFLDNLFENMEKSFDHLMENSNEQEIKEFIKLYNDVKYSGKLDYTYTKRTITRDHGKTYQVIMEENPVIVSIEDKIGKKLVEFAKQDYDGTVEFIKSIPKFITGQNEYSSNYKTRTEILPQILGVKLSDEDVTILEGKNNYDEIMRFMFRKKGSSAKKDNKKDIVNDIMDHSNKEIG